MPIIQSGEYLVDDETGEIVEFAEVAEIAGDPDEFHIQTMDHVEWLHEKVFNLDSETAMLKAKKAAYIANIDAMLNETQRKRDWLERRFGAETESVVKQNVKKDAKSLKTPFGRIGWSKSGGGIKIVNEEEAVKWCKTYNPDSVKKVETVLVSLLGIDKENNTITQRWMQKSLHVPIPEGIFTIEPTVEKFYIK